MWWLLLACVREPGPAPAGTRSAELATRAADIAQRSKELAAHAQDLEGWFDELRVAPPDQQEAILAKIRERAAELKVRSEELRDDVILIEQGAEIY